MSVLILKRLYRDLSCEIRSDETHFNVYSTAVTGRPVAVIYRRRVYSKGPAWTCHLVNVDTKDGGDLGGFHSITTMLRTVHAKLASLAAIKADPEDVGTVEDLKVQGRYSEAGAMAYRIGLSDAYGCHYGMRSDCLAAIEAFHHGWHNAKLV